MIIIKDISAMIDDELDGAEEYVKHALEWKQKNPTLAKVFYDISMQEMTHVNMLHTEVAKLIEQHRKEKGEPPASMMAIYDYLHKKHIEEANEIKMYQAQYRGE
jgi:rubrerythrin